MSSETVTATIVDMGDVKIERIGSGEIAKIPRGVVIQFDTVEDFKRAVTTGRVRMEWPTDRVTPTVRR